MAKRPITPEETAEQFFKDVRKLMDDYALLDWDPVNGGPAICAHNQSNEGQTVYIKWPYKRSILEEET